jgi:TrmH family RNA methyltransferase
VLTNVGSDRVKRVRRLARSSARRQTGQLLVEGPHACAEAAQAGLVSDLYVAHDAAGAFPRTIAATLEAGGYLHEASGPYVAAISGAAQGIVAVARDPWAGVDVSTVLGTVPNSVGPLSGLDGAVVRLVAVFEQVQDPGNAGTAIRAADAAGADLVAFTDRSVDPTSPKVIRASAGSYFHLPVVRAGNVGDLIDRLRQAGLQVLTADGDGRVPLAAAELDRPTAWLFGNEAHGASASSLAASDESVRIEIYGRAESLNLAMAATLSLYASAEALRRRGGRD